MQPKILFIFIIAFLFTSCVEHHYFVSPNYGNATPYHTLPLNVDSSKSQLYLNGSFMTGTSNYDNTDNQFAFNANMYNTNSFSNFKIWYGAGLTLGNYDVNTSGDTSNATEAYIYSVNGNKFYGSVNGNVGATYGLQIGNVEWRILGLELSAQQEFGEYLNFRQKFADTKLPVDGNVTDAFLLTTGLSTEVCIKIPNGSFNIFQQYNILTGKNYTFKTSDFDENGNPSRKTKRYSYISSTYSVTLKNMTYFLQQNVDPFFQQTVAYPRLYNIQVGVNYRLPSHTKR